MNKTKRFISVLLSVLMVISVMLIGVTATAATETASISYSFTKSDAGFAQGTITVTPTSGNYGTYYLYWADNTKALEGYRAIGSLAISSGSKSITMPAQTAIPADATQVIAFKATSEPAVANRTVAKASATYAIPASRQLSFTSEDALYTFGAVSDPQIANDSYGSGSYPHDETHWAAALETMAQRGVDFMVSSGDTVNDQNGKQTLASEYKTYQKILAESSYANPIYEANGNHDVGTVWDKNGNYYNDDDPFVKGTGLDSVADTLKAKKPYFEITEPTTGDHFIFMALEGGFYTNKGTQFSKEQLDWLEGLLKKYSTDGKNIFIIEHANVAGWGSGDKLTAPYYYDLGLIKSNSDVQRFVKLMETYKECVIITGHTHLELSAQYNYSDNNGTSAVMMHNSAIGGVRRLINGSVDRTAVLGLSEGYIVEVFEDCIIFNGTNLYHNEIMPLCSYIIPFDTEAIEKPTEPDPQPTTAPTQPTTTKATEPTTAPKTEPTTKATEPTSTVPKTEPTTTEAKEPTTANRTEPTSTAPNIQPTTVTDPSEEYLYGDADLDGKITVKDATTVQKHAADMLVLEGKAFIQANVSGDKAVNVRDATSIQKYVAELIHIFPVEENPEIAPVGASTFEQTLTEVKEDLDKYYTYSSYDQFMALKKAYLTYKSIVLPSALQTAATAEMEALQAELYEIVEVFGAPPAGGEITVYFTNNYNWSTVKAYVWGSGGTMSSWSGSEMTYAKTNSQNQKIYSITFNYDDYQKIIFNDGSKQTVDIELTGESGIGYYISGESGGKYTCSTYTYA